MSRIIHLEVGGGDYPLDPVDGAGNALDLATQDANGAWGDGVQVTIIDASVVARVDGPDGSALRGLAEGVTVVQFNLQRNGQFIPLGPGMGNVVVNVTPLSGIEV